MLQIIKSILKPAYVLYRKKRYFYYVTKHHAKIKNRNGCPIRVLFIVQYPEMWNSLKTVYESANKSKNIITIILAVPKRKTVTSSAGEFESDNAAYDYFTTNSISCIRANINNSWLKIDTLNPDYIFIQRPYDGDMPSEYQLKNLEKYGLLCYVPYASQITKGEQLKIEFNVSVNRSLYVFFADNQFILNYYISECNNEQFKPKKAFYLGFPRFDLLFNETVKPKRLTVLWTPRWSLSDYYFRSYFFDYYKCLLGFFDKHTEIDLIIRPHPHMFRHFIEVGRLTELDVKHIKEEVEAKNNVSWDTNPDYLISFAKSSVLISDYSSLVFEYFITGKPIIFCSYNVDFNIIGEQIKNKFYSVHNDIELINRLNRIILGEDENKEERLKFIKDNFYIEGNAGQRIVQELLKDAE